MTSRTDPPQESSDLHAAVGDQASIDDELDAFEVIVRAAHDAELRSVTSTLISKRSH